MKQKYLAIVTAMLATSTSVAFAASAAALPQQASPFNTPLAASSTSTNSSQKSMIQGTNAGGEKQMTVIDAGGNLKVVEPSKSELPANGASQGPVPPKSSSGGSISSQNIQPTPGQPGKLSVMPNQPSAKSGPVPSPGNMGQATPPYTNQQVPPGQTNQSVPGQGMQPGQVPMPGNPPQGMQPGQMPMPGNPPQGMQPGQMPVNPPQGMQPGQMPVNPPQGMQPGQVPAPGPQQGVQPNKPVHVSPSAYVPLINRPQTTLIFHSRADRVVKVARLEPLMR